MSKGILITFHSVAKAKDLRNIFNKYAILLTLNISNVIAIILREFVGNRHVLEIDREYRNFLYLT